MAICINGHYYDESRDDACPDCRELDRRPGPAPSTLFEDDGRASRPSARRSDVSAGSGRYAPHGRSRPGSSPATAFDLDEQHPRLMGFLVITRTRDDVPHRYVRLTKGVHRLGRFGERADIELRDGDISSEHAIVICTRKAARLVDLDSTNGTFVNGERVELAELGAGDAIRVGRTELAFVPFPYVADD